MPGVDIDRDAAHEAAQRELDKSIYPKPSLTDLIGDWLNEMLYRLLLKGASVPGGWFTIAVLAIIAVVAIIVIVRIMRRTMRTDRGGTHQLFGLAELSAAEHRASAEQNAARGNWAAAIRHRLRAVARHLEESGVLDTIPGRTAGELARDAGVALPALSSEFAQAATAFNDVTYGEQPGTSQAYRLIAELDDHLQSRTTATAGSTATTAVEDWVQVR